MNRQEKENVVHDLKISLTDSKGLFLVNYRGMTVAQLQGLRKSIRQSNGLLKVAKVRLVKRAIEDLPGSENLMPLLKEQIALVFAEKESPMIAKVIYEFAKQHESLKVIAGYVDQQMISSDTVSRLAKLPSREVLIAQFAYAIKAPINNLAGALSGLPAKLVRILKQVEQQKH